MKRAVIGFGEVGKSLKELCDRHNLPCGVIDPYLGKDIAKCQIDILHITIPYSEEFVGIVENYRKYYSPELTIVHSTVEVGTMDRLKSKGLAYTYVTGRHPQLADEMPVFIKPVAANDRDVFLYAQEELEEMGFEVFMRKMFPFKTLELAKLADTTYYGICIAWHKEMYGVALKHGIDTVDLSFANEVYNDGYARLGVHNVQRPNLRYEDGGIGGHCVMPNAHLLEREMPGSHLIRAITEKI